MILLIFYQSLSVPLQKAEKTDAENMLFRVGYGGKSRRVFKNNTLSFYFGGVIEKAEGNKSVYRPAYVILIGKRP